MSYRLLLGVLAISLGGCAGSSAVSTGPPDSLDGVNRLLAGRDARIETVDSTTVTGRSALVTPDSVWVMTERGPLGVPTPRVVRITYERDRFSPGTGAAVGTKVGAAVGVSLVALLAATEDTDGIVSPTIYFVLGGVVAAGGALFGLMLGLLEDVGPQERVAYEGPVTRYGSAGVERRQ